MAYILRETRCLTEGRIGGSAFENVIEKKSRNAFGLGNGSERQLRFHLDGGHLFGGAGSVRKLCRGAFWKLAVFPISSAGVCVWKNGGA
jgi:hypothetical protein